MTDDIVDRLMNYDTCQDGDVDEAAKEITRLRVENEQLSRGILAVRNLMCESRGVVGLHLTGDESPWDELRTGGSFEVWLKDFDNALEGVQERGSDAKHNG